MRIFRHYEDLPEAARGAAVALGNFDGVHRGHRAVIAAAGEAARQLGVPQGVVTLEPHPRQFFRPQDPPFRLTPFRVKARCLEALSVEILYNLHFDERLAAETAERFALDVLGRALGVRHVAVGYDFVFGRGRKGDAALLRALLGGLGVGVTVLEPVRGMQQGGLSAAAVPGDAPVVSSTEIRAALQAGDPRRAAQLLGRPWEIDGRVEHGDARGRTLGFPTANLSLGEYLRPRAGVYAVEVEVEPSAKPGGKPGGPYERHKGVAYFGSRPTVAGVDLRLETHLFDFSGDLYGRHMRVALIDWIRPETEFAGLEKLKAQIARDSAAARRRLG